MPDKPMVAMTRAGDVIFLDGTVTDGKGIEALRLKADGEIAMHGVAETDGKLIVAAFRGWLTRALDCTPERPPGSPAILGGSVTICAARIDATRWLGAASITISAEGDISVSGVLVERDERLLRNLREWHARSGWYA